MYVAKNIETADPVSYPHYGNEWCRQIEDTSFWFRHRNSCIVEVLRNWPPEGVLFDVGGGNGCVALATKRAGFDAIVVEPNLSGAMNSCARGLNPVICATLQGAGFKPLILPAIGLFDVLEHIKNDLDFLCSVHSYLMHKGRIYITVPAFRWLWSSEDDFAGHFKRYTLSELSAKFRSPDIGPR